MHAKIRGNVYNITKEQIKKAMEGVEPDDGRKYFVNIQGKKYPIKQVIAKTLGIPAMAFTTQDAWNILERLKYKIIVRK